MFLQGAGRYRSRLYIKTRVRTRQEDPGTSGEAATDHCRIVTEPETPGFHGPLIIVMEAGCDHGQRGPGRMSTYCPDDPGDRRQQFLPAVQQSLLPA